MTINEFAKHVIKNAQGQWFIGTVQVEYVGTVAIKAYGNWVQVMQWQTRNGNTVRDSSPSGLTSQRAAIAWINNALENQA